MTGEKAFEYADFYDFDESDDEVEEIDDGNTAEMVRLGRKIGPFNNVEL